MKFFILVLISFFSMSLTYWTSENHDGFSVEMKLSAEKIEVLDSVQLMLTLFYPNGYNPDIAVIKKNLSENGAMRKYQLVIKEFEMFPEKSETPGHISKKILFTLEPQVTGTYELTFFNIPFIPNIKTEKNAAVEIISEILSFSAVFPKTDPNYRGTAASLLTFSTFLPIELSDENRMSILENPDELEKRARENKKIIEGKTIPFLGLIGSVLSILLIWLFLKKDKSIEMEKPLHFKVISVQSQADEELKNLRNLHLPENKRFDEFYVALTDLLRKYIERRYLIMAPKQTTEEFLKDVDTHPAFSEEQRKGLKNFIELSDRVKFAKYDPSLEECEKAYQAALEFIQNMFQKMDLG